MYCPSYFKYLIVVAAMTHNQVQYFRINHLAVNFESLIITHIDKCCLKYNKMYGTDLMQRHGFACVRVQIHPSSSGTTQEYQCYYSRVCVPSL